MIIPAAIFTPPPTSNLILFDIAERDPSYVLKIAFYLDYFRVLIFNHFRFVWVGFGAKTFSSGVFQDTQTCARRGPSVSTQKQHDLVC